MKLLYGGFGMKIVFLHYHLKTGGVATVIRQQAEALKDHCDGLILAGEVPEDDYPFPTVEIPGLGYESEDRPPEPPEKTAHAVLDAIFDRWKDGCDVLHAHNATLAKNNTLLRVLKILQERGIRLLVQIHDFAEDGRPAAFSREPYPRDCHYAAINSRDFGFLAEAGLEPEGLHLVPNMVDSPPELRPVPLSDNVLYPVRAIRRKNIGEAVLLSLFFRKGEKLAITRPPDSPADMESYEDWKAFCKTAGLAVVFEAGLHADFGDLMGSARHIVNTSITEGFGFSFLEPWLYGKGLRGRSLPDICADFMKNGVRLDRLYPKLPVPLDRNATESFVSKWTRAFQDVRRRFDLDPNPAPPVALDENGNGLADFGLLDEHMQRSVLARLIEDRKSLQELRRINPFLEEFGRDFANGNTIVENKKAILENYNRDNCRKLLLDVYAKVCEIRVGHRIDKHVLLRNFLVPARFSLLKWVPYERQGHE